MLHNTSKGEAFLSLFTHATNAKGWGSTLGAEQHLWLNQ